MTKTYICFYFPDNCIEEREVSSRTAPITNIPPHAYAYQFYDRTVVQTEDGEFCYGLDRNGSPITYIGSLHFTVDYLEEIVMKMKRNGDKDVIITACGDVYPYDPDAKVVSHL
ncbi:MAG: hypothetical protein E7314_02895 [Clostridiales bacterium]|nr:hypothetical protein [Clostridiales bacterium]